MIIKLAKYLEQVLLAPSERAPTGHGVAKGVCSFIPPMLDEISGLKGAVDGLVERVVEVKRETADAHRAIRQAVGVCVEHAGDESLLGKYVLLPVDHYHALEREVGLSCSRKGGWLIMNAMTFKDCPFCGSNDIQPVCNGFATNTSYHITCMKCGAKSRRYSKLEQAVEAWNRRAGEKERNDLVLMASDAIHQEADLRRTINDVLDQQSRLMDSIQDLINRVDFLEKRTGDRGRDE